MALNPRRIFITGGTGNVGQALLKKLNLENQRIFVGVRKTGKLEKDLPDIEAEEVEFDFEKPETFPPALQKVDYLFLLRPPNITDIKGVFEPLIEAAKNLKGIVFLSVQGAEKSSWIPHHKIEKLIESSGIPYIFLRPGYFMQNLTSTLRPDIVEKQKIVLPAGKAVFNWVDTQDIGEVAAKCLSEFETYSHQAYDVTGRENLNYEEVTHILNRTLGLQIEYKSVNPLHFYFYQKKKGIASGFIIVMIILHFLPRFQKAPRIADTIYKICGHQPTSIVNFAKREAHLLRF